MDNGYIYPLGGGGSGNASITVDTTPNASSNNPIANSVFTNMVNTLDDEKADYEDGVFSLVTTGTSVATGGITVFEGNYQKVGNIVHVYGSYKLPDGVTLPWEDALHGLPFPISKNDINFFVMNINEGHIMRDPFVNDVIATGNDYIVQGGYGKSYPSGSTVRLVGVYATT